VVAANGVVGAQPSLVIAVTYLRPPSEGTQVSFGLAAVISHGLLVIRYQGNSKEGHGKTMYF
jgi:hypothetical protein